MGTPDNAVSVALSTRHLELIERQTREAENAGSVTWSELLALIAEVKAARHRAEGDALAKIVTLLEGQNPCCGCCDGESGYKVIVAEVKAIAAEVNPSPGALTTQGEVERLRGIFKLMVGPCERWRLGSNYVVGDPALAGERTHAKDGRLLAVAGAPSCLEDAVPTVARCPSCKARGALGLAVDDEP